MWKIYKNTVWEIFEVAEM